MKHSKALRGRNFVRDNLSVDLVGLLKKTMAFGEITNLPRIDDCHTNFRFMQHVHQCIFPTSGAFANDKCLKSIERALEKFIKELSKESPNVGIIDSVPGVGLITTATLYCELPELGKVSRTKLAKLVGVAPMAKQSGKSDGKRPVRGGRSTVRRVLYMAALVGTQKNPVIRTFYLKLLQKGKPKKLALVACMRKLLLTIHDMVRNQQTWDPLKKANDQAASNLATGSTCSAGH